MKIYKTYALTIFCVVGTFQLYAQNIINSERILSKIDSDFVFGASLDGDLKFGNINLVETNLSTQIGKKIHNNIFRAVFNYSYTSENNEVLSNDWTGQLRLNHFIKNNSVFFFIQGQNVMSLNIKYRYLFGSGYRMKILGDGDNYLDLSLGVFKESELYNNNGDDLLINNLRYSISVLSKVKISEKLIFNNTFYWQINTKKTSDYRLYLEPRFNYSISDDFELFFALRNRYHSSPYVDIKNNDSQTTFGIEFTL